MIAPVALIHKITTSKIHFPVAYDLSRLVERMNNLHATGIDRVDLHYALWMRSTSGSGKVLSNAQMALSDYLDYVDDLLNTLALRWLKCEIGHIKSEISYPKGWQNESKISLLKKLSLCSYSQASYERGHLLALCSLIASLISKQSTKLPFPNELVDHVYVNIGHCMRFEACLKSIPDRTQRIYFLHDIIPLTHQATQKTSSRHHFNRLCWHISNSNTSYLSAHKQLCRQSNHYASIIHRCRRFKT